MNSRKEETSCFLDKTGIAKMWETITDFLSKKQDSLSSGTGVIIEDDEISVTTPIEFISQTNYDTLDDEIKKNGTLYITQGVPSDGGRSPVPTGAIISFMAVTAPSGYLVCDGSEHNIDMYKNLSIFFQEQFGSSNYFGGDGVKTFAVPDMRNLFMRGYHGEAEENLSGEIGVLQKATNHVAFDIDAAGNVYLSLGATANITNPSNMDSITDIRTKYAVINRDTFVTQADITPVLYTSRPVNMAVLYCIKT